MVLFTPVLLLLIKLIILAVEVVFVISSYNPDRQFFSLDNIHNLAAIPVGLFGIYGYNMFLIIINKFVPEKSDSFLGIILLVMFVLFDCTRMFFVFLTGTGMQTCVYPFLAVDTVSHFLKNCIKGFLATFIGIPFLTICKDKSTPHQQVRSNKCNMPLKAKKKSMKNLNLIFFVHFRIHSWFSGVTVIKMNL